MRNKLLGAWELDAGFAKATVNYTNDNRYTATMVGMASGSASGTWELEGDQLTETTETSTINTGDIGNTQTSTIVTLDDTILVVRLMKNNGIEELITLKRVGTKAQ